MKNSRLINLVNILLLALVLTSCATTIKLREVPQYRNVGVVSLLGNEANLYYRGFTIFDNDYMPVDASAWEIDKFLADNIVTGINQESRFTAKQITLSSEQRHRFNIHVREKKLAIIKEELLKIAKQENIDLLIFSVPTTQSEPHINSSFTLTSYGFRYNLYNFFLPFIVSELHIIDTQTNITLGKVLLYGHKSFYLHKVLSEEEKKKIKEDHEAQMTSENWLDGNDLSYKFEPPHHGMPDFSKLDTQIQGCLIEMLRKVIKNEIPRALMDADLIEARNMPRRVNYYDTLGDQTRVQPCDNY